MRDQRVIADGREQLKRFLRGTPEAITFLRSLTIETVMDATNASEPTLRAHAAKCGFVQMLETIAHEDDPKPNPPETEDDS